MMYFFDFSPPADVFASNPALAAISTKLILGGVSRASFKPVSSFLCCPVAGDIRHRLIRVSAAKEGRMMVSLYVPREYPKVPLLSSASWLHSSAQLSIMSHELHGS